MKEPGINRYVLFLWLVLEVHLDHSLMNIYGSMSDNEIKNISNGAISIALKSPNDTHTHRINLKEYYNNTVYFS